VALFLGCFAAIALATVPLRAQDQGTPPDKTTKNKSVGFVLSTDATEKDVGLPIYPGAKPHKDNSDDTPALHMGIWGGSSGFRLVVLKLESKDSPGKVAAWYRKPLSKFGQVVECGTTPSTDQKRSKSAIKCDSDQPVKGGFTLEAGTEQKKHVVGVEPNGSGSLISLVNVESPDSNKDQQ
jgi:hypothetical protein